MECKRCGEQNLEGSKFCSKCGTNLTNNNVLDSFKMAVKNIGLIKLTALFLAVVMLSMFMLLIFNNPLRNFKGAINAGNFKEASTIYSDKIDSTDTESEVIGFLELKTNNILTDFKNKKLEYNDALSMLNKIKGIHLLDGLVTRVIEDMNKLNDSRNSFKLGSEFIEKKEYRNALTELTKVIEEDENYVTAHKAIENIKIDYKNEILATAKSLAEKSKYHEASQLIREAMQVIPNDSELVQRKDAYDDLYEEELEEEKRKKIEEAKNKQIVIVERASIFIQSANYKSLYPDMIQVIVRNNSDKAIKNMVVSSLGFDSNNLPVKIEAQFDFNGGSYELLGNADNVNIVPGATFGKNNGWSLTKNHRIKTVLSCVKEVEFYDDTTWQNPYYEYWIEEYRGKPLAR